LRGDALLEAQLGCPVELAPPIDERCRQFFHALLDLVRHAGPLPVAHSIIVAPFRGLPQEKHVSLTATRRIRIGHSPDPDDAFMYYAIAKGRWTLPATRWSKCSRTSRA
jgi:hypothetical protein